MSAAQARISQAYDPELFRQLGQALITQLAEHFQRVENAQGHVLNWYAPEENLQQAQQYLQQASDLDGEDFSQFQQRFTALIEQMLSHGMNLHNPRYVGHQVPPSLPIAGLFDALGGITNQVMAIYEMGPWATAVENAVLSELGQLIGWEAGTFSGCITHGGSLANLTALLTARNVALPDAWETGIPRTGPQPVLVAHAEAHYCIARSAGILGLGTQQVVRAQLDEKRRMDPRWLDEQLSALQEQNVPVIAVAACACATPVGAFDPLEEIAEICRKFGVWLHVDAAHGGAALFSPRYRHLLKGLEHADSLIWDAHKMLFVPALCAFVFYKNREHRFEAFRQDAPYLFDPSAPGLAEFDGGLKTIECTKRAAAFGMWGMWSLFGPRLFRDLVETTFDLGKSFYRKLSEAEDFQPLHEPQCNIVAFRYLPPELKQASPETIGRLQLDLRKTVIQSGEFYLVPTAYEGVAALRTTLINPLTTEQDLDHLLHTLRQQGQKQLAACLTNPG